ncbi:flagellar hook-length control protein FliK [Sphingomonas japonica]|uniref:Flagellar hook-length control protein-like C-terminal domain-containing protein n=1 Tax=Sphingomonas japonica TaxID=511662 RepID=A0ABX0U398_9SPHN|nr:flagellar hook-length control protein FliK [Sphingomonas japonica]NIJ23827.1 hypothetical protein [Sphingomonas japonica]
MLPGAAPANARQPLAETGKPLPDAPTTSAEVAPTAARLIADDEALDLVPPALAEDSPHPAAHPGHDGTSQPHTVSPAPIALALRITGIIRGTVAPDPQSDVIKLPNDEGAAPGAGESAATAKDLPANSLDRSFPPPEIVQPVRALPETIAPPASEVDADPDTPDADPGADVETDDRTATAPLGLPPEIALQGLPQPAAPDVPVTPAAAAIRTPALGIDDAPLPRLAPTFAEVGNMRSSAADAAIVAGAETLPGAQASVPEAREATASTRYTAPGETAGSPATADRKSRVATDGAVRSQPEPPLAQAPPTASLKRGTTSIGRTAALDASLLPTPAQLPSMSANHAPRPAALPDIHSIAHPDSLAADGRASGPRRTSQHVALQAIESSIAAIRPRSIFQAASGHPTRLATMATAAPVEAAPSAPVPPPASSVAVPASPIQAVPPTPLDGAELVRTPVTVRGDAAVDAPSALPAPASMPRTEPVAVPAGQAFASAVFAAVETVRHKPAPRGSVAELAMIAGIDLSSSSTTSSIIAPAAAATLDTSRADWMGDMIDRIEMLTAAVGIERRETRVRLNPDQLGSVEIAIERDGDTTNLRFTAETAATRTLLADAVPRLAEIADARGLRLGQTQVDLGGNAAQSNAQHQRQPEPQGQANRTPAPATPAADDAAEPTDRLA